MIFLQFNRLSNPSPMLKKSSLPLIFLSLISLPLLAQPQEGNLLYHWEAEGLPTTFYDGSYNDTWGVFVNNREIAVMGSTIGVHFFDLTDPSNIYELENAFIEGEATGPAHIHRDYHDFGGYLYTVADQGSSTLQVIDIQQLPDTTTIVYDSDELIRRAHNIFIDSSSARLYACGVTAPGQSFSLRILSLDDPTQPTVIGSYPNGNLALPYVHDTYVRGDTAYLNCGFDGFYVVDFSDPTNPNLLGTMTDYPQEGYNHSGWLHPDGNYYYMADETHGRDLKVVDVSDFSDMSVILTFNADSPDPSTIAHNLIVHDGYLYVSYYYDGLQIFDLSDPANPVRSHFYDTYEEPNDASYRGAWGVYPFLPSKNILVSDMQNGMFIIEAIEEEPSSVNSYSGTTPTLSAWPNPVSDHLTVKMASVPTTSEVQITLQSVQGQLLHSLGEMNLSAGDQVIELPLPEAVSPGLYILSLQAQDWRATMKVLKQ
jgi:choice-of-anchor B domain-containing protein